MGQEIMKGFLRTLIKDKIYALKIATHHLWKKVHTHVGMTHTHAGTSTNDLHSTMSCVLLEELAPTPLEAVQVMVENALSIITLVALRVLVTLSSAMESSVELVIKSGVLSSLKGTPFMNQEIVGEGTPVAVHITTAELPSDTVTVGFGEMVATGATANGEKTVQVCRCEVVCCINTVCTHPTPVAPWSCWSSLQNSQLNRCKSQCPPKWC